MDVWCLDCDRAVLVPIDDVYGEGGETPAPLGLWRSFRRKGRDDV